MKKTTNNGFTIVETLVVLAVSGVIFAVSVAMVSGRQAKVQFRNAMTDITSDIQKITNEAASGYYPNTGTTPFWCRLQVGNIQVLDAPGNNKEQGANKDCIYLGRAIMFETPTADSQNYYVHTVVGLKKYPTPTGKKEVTSFAQAQAVPISLDEQNGISADISEMRTLQFGTKVAWIRGPGGERLAGLAFVINPNQTGYTTVGASEQLKSGVATVSTIPIYSGSVSETGVDKTSGARQITETLRNQRLLAGASICFRSGTTQQSALVNVGSTGGTSSVEYNIFNNINCTP